MVAVAVGSVVGGLVLVAVVAALLVGPVRLRSWFVQKPKDSQHHTYLLMENEK